MHIKSFYLGIIVIVVVLVAGVVWFLKPQFIKHQNNQQIVLQQTNQSLDIKEDKDEHGCVVSSGYKWCEAQQKCLLVSKEQCNEASTTDITANWKTYTNEKYGFSLRYLPTFTHVGEEVPDPLGEGIRIGPSVFVIVKDDAKRKEAEQMFNKYYNYIKNPPLPNDNEEAVSVYEEEKIDNPYISVRNVRFFDGFFALIKGNSYDIFVDGTNRTFDFAANNFFNASDQGIGDADVRMLSSFRFTTSTQ
jgi:hypothetical protein